MQFTTIEDAVTKLREMGNQFICPKDRFFGPLADAIEDLLSKFPSRPNVENECEQEDFDADYCNESFNDPF